MASDFFFGVGPRAYYDWDKDGLPDYFDSHGVYHKNIGTKGNPSYIVDNNGPYFISTNSPLVFTDINNDGVPEVFDNGGLYSTLAPVPAVQPSSVSLLGRNFTKLSVSPANAAYTYQWYRNNTPVPLARQSYIYALLPGTYTATIKDSCGTGVSLPYKVAHVAATDSYMAEGKLSAADAGNNAIKITAYPNPFSSTITVQLPATCAAAMVQVTDMQGRILIKEKMNGNQLTMGKQLAAGVYLLQVMQNNTLLYTQKLIKE